MTQRNPMNDRYTTDRAGGATRKGSTSMKPASKAAASVRVQSKKRSSTPRRGMAAALSGDSGKSKEQRRAERAKQREQEDLLYTASSVLCGKDEKYRRLRRWWWGLLAGAVVFTVLSWAMLSTQVGGTVLSVVVLVLAYASIIGALVMDVTVVRKRRNLFRDKVNSMSKKQVERIVEQNYVERRAKDAGRKARRAARKDKSADPQQAYQEAYEATMAAGAKGALDYTELKERAGVKDKPVAEDAGQEDGKKAGRRMLFGKSKASEQAAAGSTEIHPVEDDAPASDDAAPGEEPVDGQEAARKEEAAKIAREFARSRRAGSGK